MSTPAESQPRHERRWIYIGACVILIALGVWAVLAFSVVRETARADEKADQLIAALEEAGARTPDKDQVVRVLSEEGGAAGATPTAALRRATNIAQHATGATGPGARPVVADSRVVQGQLLIIEIYCPEELDEFRAFVEDLKTDEVAGT